jgi:uncharacterized protein
VAVASGSGLATVFRSLGASYIVNGGQTNNPSTEEIFQAIEQLPTDKVLILPNNKNIFLAAEAARDLSTKQVAVIPSRSIPQGISALMALNPAGEIQANAQAMERNLRSVRTGEMTRATRSVELDGVAVQEGALIGLVDGKLCSSGPDEDTVLDKMLHSMDMEDCGIVTIYYGLDVTKSDASSGWLSAFRPNILTSKSKSLMAASRIIITSSALNKSGNKHRSVAMLC